MDYIYNVVEYIYDRICYSESPSITYDQIENNFQINNKDEIDKLIKEVENEIRIDKEIKIMQLRYDNLCNNNVCNNNFSNDNSSNDNSPNDNSPNDSILTIKKVKKIKI